MLPDVVKPVAGHASGCLGFNGLGVTCGDTQALVRDFPHTEPRNLPVTVSARRVILVTLNMDRKALLKRRKRLERQRDAAAESVPSQVAKQNQRR